MSPPPTPLNDQQVRDRAVSALDVSMTVNAGAGSGKTSVLVSRIVALLETGTVAPRALAAITFTEKAAGELLARVRDALETALRRADDDDDDRARRLSAALDRFGELTLTTIHSFCRDLLRHESLEAGFAPDTELGDDAAAEGLLSAALDGWLADVRVRRPALWRIVEQLVSGWTLHKAAENLYRYRSYDDVVCVEAFDAGIASAELTELRQRIDLASAACVCPDDDKLIGKNARLVAMLDAALAQPAPLDGVLDALLSEVCASHVGGKAADWGGPDGKEAYRLAVSACDVWRARWLSRAHGEVIRDLRAHLVPRFDAEKRAQSVATFDDLLREAAHLLRTSGVARDRLAARYRVVLIDEVQDTDPVQAEVATLLTRSAVQSGPWHQSVPEPGRLFVVGDPKQSIYRFRGADVETFRRLEGVVVVDGERGSLARNFRSVPGIVSWVNHVFAGLDGYEQQVAHRGPAELDPVVLLQATAAVSETECAVRHLHGLFSSSSSARVVDRHTNMLRPVEPRDVMLLLPGWSHADRIADRLRRSGIECVVEGGDTFFGRDEVRLSMAALRAIVEPADTEAVAFVLRGLFGLSHHELARHARADGSLRYTIPNHPPSRVATALGALSELHRRRGRRSLAGLLDELFAQTRVLAVWSLLPDGGSRLANIDKLQAMIRAVEARTTSPNAAVDELARIERNVPDKDIDRIDDDGNAVRITSLFKAKGLEAPVVVFLEAHRSKSPVPVIVNHQRGEVALSLGALLPPDWEELKRDEDAQQAEERRRWTYVAATRARDQLVFCRPLLEMKKATKKNEAPQPKSRTGCLLVRDVQPRGLPAVDDVQHGARFSLDPGGAAVRVLLGDELPPVIVPLETFPGLDADVDALLSLGASTTTATGDPDGVAREAEMRASIKAATKRCVRWRAATSDETSSKWAPGVPIDAGASQESVGGRGGRVIHAVMERLDLSRPTAILSPQARELCGVLGAHAALPSDIVTACQNIVERILRNPLIDKARTASERWHEVPFTYETRPGSVISGTIDLCFPANPEKTEWIVFDWKSKVPDPRDKLYARYVEQLQSYATALLKGLGATGEVKVIETQIVGPYPELGVVAAVDDVLHDVRGDLRGPLAELIEQGIAVPRIGCDVGDPPVSVELFFESATSAGRGLVIGPELSDVEVEALSTQGFVVRRSIDDEARALLGVVAIPAEDS